MKQYELVFQMGNGVCKMNNSDITNKIILCFEKVGIYLPTDENEDLDLYQYGMDSMQFISFIVTIEDSFNITFPDELLTEDTFKSLYGLKNLIQELVEITHLDKLTS